MAIKLIVGLCNPGPSYEKTRHNAGAWFVSALASHHGLSFKLEKKFHAEISLDGGCRLAIPTNYMNLSGQAVSNIAQFYKIKPEEILIAHDELDLDPGVIKLKFGGGHGGHNGLRDVIGRLKSKDFHRLRIGIGHPGHKDDVTDFVLGKPSNIDKIAILNAIDRAIDISDEMLSGEMQKAMQSLHS